MKKIHAFILLNCLFFTVLGYHFIYRYQIREAKEQMRAYIRSAPISHLLVTLEFSSIELSKLEWENDHEFRFHDKMYDLVVRQEKKGRVFLSCISDENENRIVKAYQQANRSTSRESGPLSELVRLVSAPFIVTSMEWPSVLHTEIASPYGFTNESLIRTPSVVRTPPPELIA